MNTNRVPEWTLADRLRKARESARLERDVLAQLTGLHRNSIGNYERGLRTPAADVVSAWAEACGVDRNWLEAGEEGDSPSQALLADLDEWLRARRDSNPQPSVLESHTILELAA